MRTQGIRIAAVFLTAISLAIPARNAHAWGKFEGGHHPAYGGNWARPRPEVVHRTYVDHGHPGGGCVGCGVGIAAVAGLVGGAIIAGALSGGGAPPPPPPQPVYVQAAPVGTEVAVLPPGCTNMNVNGTTYYQCGPAWYQPYMGGDGVYYAVVPAP